MVEASEVVFVIAAVGGALLAGLRFWRKQNPPLWLAALHGLLAAAGLALLATAVVTAQAEEESLIALALFVAAALGGFALIAVHLRKKLLPGWLIVVHAAVAAVAIFVF